MQIKNFDPKYADEMAQLFVELYSDSEKSWDLETAKAYLSKNYEFFPDFNFMALSDTEEIMGAVFCQLTPYYTGQMLLIDSLQVKAEYRKQGVAKKLIRAALKKGKEKNCNGFYLMADMRSEFPREWYMKMGFVPTGWAEYKCMAENISLP